MAEVRLLPTSSDRDVCRSHDELEPPRPERGLIMSETWPNSSFAAFSDLVPGDLQDGLRRRSDSGGHSIMSSASKMEICS